MHAPLVKEELRLNVAVGEDAVHALVQRRANGFAW